MSNVSEVPVTVRVHKDMRRRVGVIMSRNVLHFYLTLPGRAVIGTKMNERVGVITVTFREPSCIFNDEISVARNSHIVNRTVDDLAVIKSVVRVETGKSTSDIQ